MLSYLIYISTATTKMTDEGLADLNKEASEKNALYNITGLLLYDSGLFFQILEGDQQRINHLFENIKKDPRNKNVTLIANESLEKRNFSGWSMKVKNISDLGKIIWLPASKEECIDTNLSKDTSMYVNIVFNLLMGVLKEEYQQIQPPSDSPNDAINNNIRIFRALPHRAKQILQLVVRGYTAKKIGRLLNISDKTAARHTEEICKKINCENKNDLIMKVFSSGYLDELLLVPQVSTIAHH